MGEFKFDPKLYDTLNDEQKKLLNDGLTQHKEYLNKNLQEEQNKLIEIEKEKWIKEQSLNKNNNDFINSIPKENQEIIKTLIDKEISIEEIKSNEKYSHLLKEKETTFIDLNSIINGTIDGVKDLIKVRDIESDEKFLKRINENGLGVNDSKEDWERYEKLKIK